MHCLAAIATALHFIQSEAQEHTSDRETSIPDLMEPSGVWTSGKTMPCNTRMTTISITATDGEDAGSRDFGRV